MAKTIVSEAGQISSMHLSIEMSRRVLGYLIQMLRGSLQDYGALLVSSVVDTTGPWQDRVGPNPRLRAFNAACFKDPQRQPKLTPRPHKDLGYAELSEPCMVANQREVRIEYGS